MRVLRGEYRMGGRLTVAIFCAVILLNAQTAGGPPRSQAGAGRQRANQSVQQQEQAVPPGAVEGQVVNAVTGEPIKKANLVLMPSQGRQGRSSYTATSDANGQFVMKGVAPGAYSLM